MRFEDIASRITGVSIPIFGVSWNPPEPQRQIVRRLITFLEDRRVLFNPTYLEVEDQALQSVAEIRRELTDRLNELPEESPAAPELRAMRAACRRFMDEPHPNTRLLDNRWGPAHVSTGFGIALGELRATFGQIIARLAVQYGINVERDLEEILPPRDNDK